MPTALSPVTSTLTGTAKALAAAATSHTVPNADGLVIEIYNGSAGTRTITFTTAATYAGRAVADDTATIVTLTNKVFGPFPQDIYGSNVAFTIDSETSVTITSFVVPRAV